MMKETILFFMFYASVAMLSLIACCYLLFRRANAIAPDITPPVRLRRWTALQPSLLLLLCATCGTCQHILSPPLII